MHHLSGIFSKMTELCVRIGNESFRIVYHCFNWSIWPVGCCVINIYGLQLNVVWTCIMAAQTNNILPYEVNFLLFLILRNL